MEKHQISFIITYTRKFYTIILIMIMIYNNICKEETHTNIGGQYLFAPTAVETLGPLNAPACLLFANLGRKISSTSGDDREGAFLFQRVLVLVQRYKTVLLLESLPAPDCTD